MLLRAQRLTDEFRHPSLYAYRAPSLKDRRRSKNVCCKPSQILSRRERESGGKRQDFKRHDGTYAFQQSEKLVTLMRRKDEFEQRSFRLQNREHGQVFPAAFQNIAKKTRITGSDTDQ